MDTTDKLKVLADEARYDLSCACGTRSGPDHRQRSDDGLWVYPTSLPRGGQSVMLKTLLSSACVNDCRYCPLRRDRDTRRCTLRPEEVADAFMAYVRRGQVHGLFLSSGVVRGPDHTMDRMVAVAEILRRKHAYGGYLHLKVLPGSSDAAIEACCAVANTVSVNVEVPTRAAMAALSSRKDYARDIVRPVRLISGLTGRGSRFPRVRQMTQFIVGASTETDAEIVRATFGLYRRLGLARVYFSAYQKGLGDAALPGERTGGPDPRALATREHRLYQVDFLIRKYGFTDEEIGFDGSGALPLDADPKELWARRHPERWPLNVNRAARRDLLRVPGFGPVTVRHILALRKGGGRIARMDALGRPGRRLAKAAAYVTFS